MSTRRVLGDWLAGRDNNFNLLRFVAASLVIYAHCFPFTQGFDAQGRGIQDGDFIYDFASVDAGRFAVQIFFIMSGFLVAQSWQRRPQLGAFARARFLRIFPGLFVCVLALAFVLGPLFTKLPLAEYFSSAKVYRFIAVDTTLVRVKIEYCLPGVFDGHVFHCALNVPHWTLPWEVMMYVALAIAGLLGFMRRPAAMAAATAAVWLGFMVCVAWLKIGDWRLLYPLAFASYFYAGTLLWLYRDRVPVNGALLLAATVLLIAAMVLLRDSAAGRALYIPLLAYVVLGAAYVPGGAIRGFNRIGDFSYGLYIYGFAAQQVVLELWKPPGPLPLFGVSLAATLLVAMASWHLLEKPMLALKGRSRKQPTPALS